MKRIMHVGATTQNCVDWHIKENVNRHTCL